jgi:hypothetical protein
MRHVTTGTIHTAVGYKVHQLDELNSFDIYIDDSDKKSFALSYTATVLVVKMGINQIYLN